MTKEKDRIALIIIGAKAKIGDKDVWENNHKENVKLYVFSTIEQIVLDAYCEGFDVAEKAFKK